MSTREPLPDKVGHPEILPPPRDRGASVTADSSADLGTRARQLAEEARFSGQRGDRFGYADSLTGPLEVDAVIVGAGPGGSSVARVLAQAGFSVLVMEDGPPRSNFRPNWAHAAHHHYQESYMMVAEGPVPLPVAAGRGVGGGSLVNSAICFRTPSAVLAGWAETLDEPRFAPAAMAAVYDEIEARIDVVPVTWDIAGENNLIVERGVRKLGLPGGLLSRNAPGCVGCGICNLGCPTGGKFSVDRNLLLDAQVLGTRVQADCRVETILVEGDRAVGVVGRLRDPETRLPGPAIEVRARVVVLSAGAIGTPRLLWMDGLAARLGPVGDTLHLHPGSGILGECDFRVDMFKGATQGAYVHDPDNPKVLPHTFNAPPEVFVAQSGLVGMEAKRLLERFSHTCGLGVMVSDSGEGSVRARKDGRARIRYRWNPKDVDLLKKGLVTSARVLLAGGAREVFVLKHKAERHRGPGSLEAEMARTPLRDLTTYSSHPMGTNPIGADPATSVCNRRGRTHRLPGLYIADAGVFPSSLGVNPQLTTMALSTVIGRAIAEDEAS